MAKKKLTKDLNITERIEASLEEVTSVENYIENVLTDDNFMKLNILQNRQNSEICETSKRNVFNANEDIEFISIDSNSLSAYKKSISEKEFYKIIGFKDGKLSSRSGLYQESLFGHYLEAKEEQDAGYIKDVLDKAVVFQNNLEYIKTLMTNKRFMEEWRKDFGKISPLSVFKENGSLRKINIINERII